jgi:hypothetical protein
MRWRRTAPARGAACGCGRKGRACICGEVNRGIVRAAARKGVDARPRPCPKCSRTMRGGICPGPDC